MLIATGLYWADLDKPQVGIGAVWYDGNPCNMHLADLGTHVKRGAKQAAWSACGSTRSACRTASRWAPTA
jgi:dihydroxyacid dehydratase/phosphogluconate dehydratase